LGELRKDVVTEGGDAEAVLRHAAKREGQFFTVPRTVEA
jgi:Asp-tRNA(Asn)/Glu-tRNA(Gln) amidotransferase C subunit